MEFRIAQSSGKMRMLPAERKEETSGSMMNHINSTTRASLNGRTPFELASLLLPSQLLTWVGASLVPHDDVILNPRLLKNSR
jgi:hypothetical protein